MKTEHRFLTRREGKKGHHETKLFINWEGVTEKQLRTLAAWAIIHEMQARYYKDPDHKPPEQDEVDASLIAQEKPMLAMKYAPPPPPAMKLSKEFENLLKQLSQEELRMLLGGESHDAA